MNVEQVYHEWLKGSSLRKLAREVGVTHSKLHGIFRKEYGEKACNVKAKSLVRSVIADYEGNAKVVAWAVSLKADETTLHRSRHSLNQLTSYQTLRQDWIAESVANPEQDPDNFGFLRLPLYVEVSTYIEWFLADLLFTLEDPQNAD